MRKTRLTVSQPTGGRYDGILGVHAGIEVLKTLNDNKIVTEYPTGICLHLLASLISN